MRQRMPPGGLLEADRAGQDTPVKLRQRHIHRQITRRQPGTRCCPVSGQTGRQDKLEHRRINSAKGPGRHKARYRRTITARIRYRKACQVQNHISRSLLQKTGDDATAFRFFQAGTEQRQRVQPSGAAAVDQRINRCQITRLHQRPVKYNRRNRCIGTPLFFQRIKAGDCARLAGPVYAGTQ